MPESTKVPTSHSTLPPASAVALRREVCDNALLLAADGPDISNQFGEIHIQNLREIGYAEEKHEILGRFYVPWSKMGTPSRFLTLCVDDRSQSREGLIILN